jgi:hypothetical protein
MTQMTQIFLSAFICVHLWPILKKGGETAVSPPHTSYRPITRASVSQAGQPPFLRIMA